MEDSISGGLQEVKETQGFRKPGLAQVCLLYSAIVLLFLIVGYRVQGREFYSGILITEFLLVLGPPLVFLLFGKFEIAKVLRLNKIKISNLFLIICIMLLAIPLAGIFNLVNLWVVNSLFGKIVLPQVPIPSDLSGLLVNILVIGGSAGLCEEFAFRGTIMRGLERFGAVKSILLTAFLFAMMHLDFQKILGTFMLGALIGFIVYRSNSLYGGMLAHFTNNSAAVIVSFLSGKFMKLADKSGIRVSGTQSTENIFSMLQSMPRVQLIAVVVVWGFILLIFAAGFAALIFAFVKGTTGLAEDVSRNEYAAALGNAGKKSLRGFAGLIPGIVMIILIYMVEAYKFKGLNTGFVKAVLKLLGV